MDGRNAEITVDLVLQTRAKPGPEDAVVSEMIKILPLEKIYTIARCFQARFYGSDGCSQFVEECETGFLAETKKGIRSYRAIALTSVMSKWYASCVMMRMERRTCQKFGTDFTWEESTT